MIKINLEGEIIEECESIIIVPERAVKEPGYIQTLTVKTHASSKHEFSAMAQMAYFQFQDDELEIKETNEDIKVEFDDSVIILLCGLVLYRDVGGEFIVVMHQGLNRKKILEAAYRFCTRWVRLDI